MLPPEQLQRVFKVLIDTGTIVAIKNPLELSHKDRLTLIDRLSTTARELEQVVGVSKITQIPTDLDRQLIERCRDKDYHDIVSNAF